MRQSVAVPADRVPLGTPQVLPRDMTRMAQMGATRGAERHLVGHTIQQTTGILDTAIPRRWEAAAGAIDAWKRALTGTFGRFRCATEFEA